MVLRNNVHEQPTDGGYRAKKNDKTCVISVKIKGCK